VPITIPYVKQTWTDGAGGGTPVSAARLGVLEEGILDVSSAPAVRVLHNANQSITSGVGTALAFNSERYDRAGGASAAHHDTVTLNTRLTSLYAGVYKISACTSFAANATGIRQLQIRLNGATIIGAVSTGAVSGASIEQNLTVDYSLAVSDYVEVIVAQNSGGALNLLTVANYSPEFMMVRVG
jgi:hypothetical protein